jgi:predicted RNA binding protein YcfA (HicA-like mRNA interferase family)
MNFNIECQRETDGRWLADAAVLSIGWSVKCQSGSHRTLTGRVAPTSYSFHDGEEIWPRMLALARIAKHTGLGD